jgi:hypothetical protein
MFIHLCVHAAYHGCSRLIWLYDLRRFVEQYGHNLYERAASCNARKPKAPRRLKPAAQGCCRIAYGDLDWPLVVRLCERWRLSLPVRIAIEHCRRVIGNACPTEVTDALAAHRVSWRDRLVLWQAPSDAERPLLHVAVNAISTPDARFAMQYLLACVCPSRAHLAAAYPWRHRGWPLCALLWRTVRATIRGFASALTGQRLAGPGATTA